MTLGAEPKKVAILCALLAVAAVILYINVFQGDADVPAPRAAVSPSAAPATRMATQTPVAPGPLPLSPDSAGSPSRRREQKSSAVSEFKPRQGYARPEDKPDPATIDPNLRLDLLARVQSVELAGASRNVFQYGSAQAPPKPVELPKNPPTIPINRPPVAAPAPPVASGPPPAPQAPPMTFKYYGFKVSKKDGRKQAFLLDGDDIIIAGENDVVKKGRYRVVRIGVNTIEVEDTQFKSTQTLKLEEGAPA